MKRKFFSFLLACVVAMATMVTTACNQQQVLTDVERFAPVITNVLAVACEFTSSPLCGPGAALLNTAEQHLFVVWQEYLSLEQNGTVTENAWNDLNAALNDLITKSSDVFALVHVINTNVQKEVLDLAAAAQALLAVIESFLPSAPASPAKAMQLALALHHPQMATFLPKPNPKTRKYDAGWFRQWRTNYNSLPAVKARKLQLRGSWLGL